MSDPLLPYSRGRHADPDPDAPALSTDRLTVCYSGGDRVALRAVSLRVARGARVALVGPNGAGKSTLLKAVAGLLPVASGGVKVYGNPVGACHHRVAYLPQRGDIDWTFPVSVARFVLAGRYVHLGWLRRPGRRDRDAVTTVLERLGLADLAGRQIGRLSGGQQQRAILARALAQGADLLLLDEPLNAVDAATRDAIDAVTADLRDEGKSMLVATHDLGRLANSFDSAVYLEAGAVVPPPAGAFCGAPCCAPAERGPAWAG